MQTTFIYNITIIKINPIMYVIILIFTVYFPSNFSLINLHIGGAIDNAVASVIISPKIDVAPVEINNVNILKV